MNNSFKDILKKKNFRIGTYTVATTVVILIIAVIINMCVNILPVKYSVLDLTAGDLYSLSAQSEQVAKAADEKVTFYWIVQDGYEDPTIEKLIQNYRDLNKNLDLKVVDPVLNPNFASKYTFTDVYNNDVVVVAEETGKFRYLSFQEIYLYSYDEEYNEITTFNGESVFTSALSYVTSDQTAKAYYMTGHGEDEIPAEMQVKIGYENIDMSEVNMVTENIPDDCQVLIIFSPQTDISGSDKKKIETYLAGGGNILLFTDCDTEALPNLYDVLASYGMSPVPGMIADPDAGHHISNYVNYLVPAISNHEITKPIFDENYSVIVPFAQGIEINNNVENTVVSALLKTSSNAYSKVAGANATTGEKEEGDIETMEGFPVAAVSTKTEGDIESNIVWITSSFTTDSQLNEMASGANMDFVINSLGYMSELENSISIRAKQLTANYLSLTAGEVGTWTAIVVAVIPLAFIVAGIVVWLKRRKK